MSIRSLILGSLLLLAPGVALEGREMSPAPADPCLPGVQPESVTLSEVLQRAQALEPGLAVGERLVAAAEGEASAVRRERVPTLALEGMANWGQRVSPGEERALGVGERAELRALLEFGLLESGRQARLVAADRRVAEARADSASLAAGFEMEVAAAFVQSALALEFEATLEAHRAALAALEGPVRMRAEAGMVTAGDLARFEDEVVRSERGLVEAREVRAGADAVLRALAGSCVSARPLAPATRGVEVTAEGHPEVRRLREAAGSREAAARAIARQDRLSLGLVGSAGPTRSRAHDPGPVEQEYLLGITGQWRIDPGGVRSRLAQAERSRSSALVFQAEQLRREQERAIERTRLALDGAEARALLHEQEEAQAVESRRVAALRWEEGVGSWSELFQAEDRLRDARSATIEARAAVALAWLALARASGQAGELPAWLGSEADR